MCAGKCNFVYILHIFKTIFTVLNHLKDWWENMKIILNKSQFIRVIVVNIYPLNVKKKKSKKNQ